MSAYFRFVLRYRVAVGAIFLALTALSLMSVSRAIVASSLNKLFFGENPAYAAYLERQREFGTEEVNIFAFESPRLLEEEQQAQLRRVLDRIEQVDNIGRVYSVLDAQKIEAKDGTLYVSNYSEEASEDPSRIPELIMALREDSLAGGLVISDSSRHCNNIGCHQRKRNPAGPGNRRLGRCARSSCRGSRRGALSGGNSISHSNYGTKRGGEAVFGWPRGRVRPPQVAPLRLSLRRQNVVHIDYGASRRPMALRISGRSLFSPTMSGIIDKI